MKITFLGTGSSRGIPREGHRDLLCRTARRRGSKSRRGRSSTLLQVKGKNIIIDVSPDFLAQAKREKLKKIDAILITHAHDDAYGGLSDLGKWIKLIRHMAIPLYAHASTLLAIKKHIPPAVLPVRVPEFHTAKVAGIKVRFIPVNHGVHHIATFGFLFDKNLFYASDMDGASERAKKIIRGAKTLILDGAFWERRMIPGHFPAPETIAFAKKLNPKKLIITQSGHTYPPHERAARELQKIARKQKCTFPVLLAYDGMKLKIDN